jgi:hypothetical protein
MAYLQTVEIDGFRIVRSFDAPPVDPMATKRVVNKLIVETDEFKKIKSAGAKMRDLYQKRSKQLRRLVDFSTVKTGASEVKALRDSVKKIEQDIVQISKLIEELQPAMKKRQKEIYNKHLVRSIIPGCEEVVDSVAEKLSEKLSKLGRGQFLTVDGKSIDDHRGKTYYHKRGEKWDDVLVSRLDHEIPADAKFNPELTEADKREIIEQKQKMMVSKMPDSGRLDEKERAKEKAIMDAALMKSGYEIEGRDDPAGDARGWLESRKKEIEALYG